MSEQLNLIEPACQSRAAARRMAADAARARGHAAGAAAAEKVDGLHADWCAQAVEKLRELAKRTYPGMFTIEQARLVINFPVPAGGDLRAWGVVRRMAAAAKYIEQVPGQFCPAASSNGSPKPLYRKGPKA